MDNEFLELYGGLQSHHEEKRQQHFIESAAQMSNSKTASSNSISNSVTGGNESNTATTTTQSNNVSNTNETIPPPSDTIVGLEPVEMKILEDEVTYDTINNDLERSFFRLGELMSFETVWELE